ncbi:MAG: glycoside hydrolase family 3 N-terminal domain-containing protein, partial [Sulfurifustaceae bacterium]
DGRTFAEIWKKDILPYKPAIEAGMAAVMPAHVIYPQVDPEPAGYSKHWLQDILRGKLGFDGLIFSDDLSMEGAKGAGDMVARAELALAAGCDMVLVCNDPAGAEVVLQRLEHRDDPASQLRRVRMRGRPAPARAELRTVAQYRDVVRMVTHLV